MVAFFLWRSFMCSNSMQKSCIPRSCFSVSFSLTADPLTVLVTFELSQIWSTSTKVYYWALPSSLRGLSMIAVCQPLISSHVTASVDPVNCGLIELAFSLNFPVPCSPSRSSYLVLVASMLPFLLVLVSLAALGCSAGGSLGLIPQICASPLGRLAELHSSPRHLSWFWVNPVQFLLLSGKCIPVLCFV